MTRLEESSSIRFTKFYKCPVLLYYITTTIRRLLVFPPSSLEQRLQKGESLHIPQPLLYALHPTLSPTDMSDYKVSLHIVLRVGNTLYPN